MIYVGRSDLLDFEASLYSEDNAQSIARLLSRPAEVETRHSSLMRSPHLLNDVLNACIEVRKAGLGGSPP